MGRKGEIRGMVWDGCREFVIVVGFGCERGTDCVSCFRLLVVC